VEEDVGAEGEEVGEDVACEVGLVFFLSCGLDGGGAGWMEQLDSSGERKRKR